MGIDNLDYVNGNLGAMIRTANCCYCRQIISFTKSFFLYYVNNLNNQLEFTMEGISSSHQDWVTLTNFLLLGNPKGRPQMVYGALWSVLDCETMTFISSFQTELSPCFFSAFFKPKETIVRKKLMNQQKITWVIKQNCTKDCQSCTRKGAVLQYYT